jgi:hypothetical protein
MIRGLFVLVLMLLFKNECMAQKDTMERVIVFMIDGLHWKAPAELKMPNYNALIKEGCYIRKSYMITPHHPTVGEYGKLHTSSFPNPVLQSGTVFIRPGNKMLQDVFAPKYLTAFVTNTIAYASVSQGFNDVVLNPSLSDKDVVDMSIDMLGKQDIRYFRIHLQTPGNEGRYLSYTTPDKPYFRNIWGKGSPYVAAVENADVLLGKLIQSLKSAGKWNSTLLIVTSDQGQSEIGWHPMIDEDSWVTPLVFVGPGIAKGRVLPYFEHTDLTPTIAHLFKLQQPCTDGGSGKFVKEILASNDTAGFRDPEYIKTINTQINQYNSLRAKIMLAAEKDKYFSSVITFLENELLTPEPFYHQDRVMEWYRAGTVQHLIDANSKILEQMKKELQSVKNQESN